VLASDMTLRQLLNNRGLIMYPEPTEDLIQPASIDVHLDRFFRVFRRDIDVIDPAIEQDLTEPVEMVDDQPFLLAPRDFVLGSTLETVKLASNVAAEIDGRSSIGRIGLLVHATAGWIDPGFVGTVTLELANLTPRPIRLYPGMRIAQLVVSVMNPGAFEPYGSAARRSSYQGQGRGPVPSAISRTWNPVSTYLNGAEHDRA
jgi:dCTP deaminase